MVKEFGHLHYYNQHEAIIVFQREDVVMLRSPSFE